MYSVLKSTPYALQFLTAVWRIGIACAFVLIAGTVLGGEPVLIRLVALSAILILGTVTIGAVKSHDIDFLRHILSGIRNTHVDGTDS